MRLAQGLEEATNFIEQHDSLFKIMLKGEGEEGCLANLKEVIKQGTAKSEQASVLVAEGTMAWALALTNKQRSMAMINAVELMVTSNEVDAANLQPCLYKTLKAKLS